MSFLDRITAPFRRAATPIVMPPAALSLAGAGIPEPVTTRAPVGMLQIRSADDVVRSYRDPVWTYNKSASPDTALSASVWVFACAREIARAARTIPLRVYKGSELAPPTDPLAQLINQPARGWTQARWTQVNAYHLTLSGRTIIRKYRARALGRSLVYAGQGLPGEIFPFTALDFSVDVNDDDMRRPIEAYKPRRGKDKADVLPRDVVDVVYVRPGKPDEGYSPTEGAAREVSADKQASLWQQHFLNNRAVPDGILVAKSSINDTQEKAIQEWLDKRWLGPSNSHLPVIMGDDLTWHDLAKTAVEMELIPGRGFNKDAICAAHGVPSVMFSASGTTYANYETARAILMGHTVLPLILDLADGLNLSVAPEFGPDYSIVPDLEASDALLPQLRARWETAKIALASGVPMSQVSESFRLGVQSYDGWDVGLVAASSVPVSSFTADVGGDL